MEGQKEVENRKKMAVMKQIIKMKGKSENGKKKMMKGKEEAENSKKDNDNDKKYDKHERKRRKIGK